MVRSQAVSLQREMARENGPSHSGLGSHIVWAWQWLSWVQEKGPLPRILTQILGEALPGAAKAT